MEKVMELLEQMGVSTILEMDDEEFSLKFEMERAAIKSGELMVDFLEHYDGLYLSDYKKYVREYDIQEEKVEEEIKEIIHSIVLREGGKNGEFEIDIDRDYLVFPLVNRERGFEVIFPEWGIKKCFIEEKNKDIEMEEHLIRKIGEKIKENKIYEKLSLTLKKMLGEEVEV